MLSSMLLIAAALAEELETALNLCSRKSKIRCAGVPMWLGTRGNKNLHLLKLGTGPVRSASVLQRVLAELKVTGILIIGYAGALDPALKQGELVVVDRADPLAQDSWGAPLEEIKLGSGRQLAGADELFRVAQAAGLPVRRGTALTSPCIMGAPEHKRVLFQRFQAAIVDMETAALAHVAANSAVPLGCVRAITDEADDTFLASLSYNPRAGAIQRAAKTLAEGGWLRRYSQWRERSLAARQALSKFLSCYLDSCHL
jgi:adenosylhomocysteine nucleosidase